MGDFKAGTISGERGKVQLDFRVFAYETEVLYHCGLPDSLAHMHS